MAIPAHIFFFITGNPTEIPAAFIVAGHLTIDTATNVVSGNITIKANDDDWITHLSLINPDFDDVTELFSATAVFSTIKGSPPFPNTLPFGPFPIGELIQSEGSPNIFLLIAEPPPV